MELYIASKPMQIAVSSIIAGSNKEDSCLIIIDMFHDAEAVFKEIQSIGDWKKVLFVKNRFISFVKGSLLKPTKTYIDGDIGTRLALYIAYYKFASRTKHIYVYEEGIGTYRNDIYTPSYKTKIFNMLGISTVFGGSWFCSGVCVFEPEKYAERIKIKNKRFTILKITKSMKNYCEENATYLNKIYNFSPESIGKGNKCFLYISDWHFESSFTDTADRAYDKKLIKLHPNIKNTFNLEGLHDFDVVENKVPAEILISALSKKYSQVQVLHHGSSVAHYMKYDNVSYLEVLK
jgi:hypothetical protein